MKVFELAEKLKEKPLALVEELKQRGFAVKNHMSSLTEKEIEKFQASRKKPIFTKEILQSIVPPEELEKRKKQKEAAKKKEKEARQKIRGQFPEKCLQLVLKLSTQLGQERTDIADQLSDEITKLVRKYPDEFSKKARQIAGVKEDE